MVVSLPIIPYIHRIYTIMANPKYEQCHMHIHAHTNTQKHKHTHKHTRMHTHTRTNAHGITQRTAHLLLPVPLLAHSVLLPPQLTHALLKDGVLIPSYRLCVWVCVSVCVRVCVSVCMHFNVQKFIKNTHASPTKPFTLNFCILDGLDELDGTDPQTKCFNTAKWMRSKKPKYDLSGIVIATYQDAHLCPFIFHLRAVGTTKKTLLILDFGPNLASLCVCRTWMNISALSMFTFEFWKQT